ncbi:hypothetical protein PANO111632_21190 [Paracoccus nototheniae]|uniref:Uncharacterized protein n=1 Tax=Paracoccus nototheniae TaxID=2489002 RepID=A0ABW4DUZ6_9RHOB|nr:hypothetical protein [Paracoccus nototheniae]
MSVRNIWPSRQVRRLVIDFHPDDEGDGVTLYVWSNDNRDSGYFVDCHGRDEVEAIIADLEAMTG